MVNQTTHAGPDLAVENHGTLMILRPESAEGREWIADHVADDAMMLGAAVVVEPRYMAAILIGADADGLTIKGNN